jgi:glycerol-3-phosphate dehydrogenase
MTSEGIQFDVVVIGAGINGAGIARDAAMRGLKVLLLDKGDIGGGTSSWSTRLIHGGLRYLEHGEFRLVRESLRERECLMTIAPHLVRPLPILVPIYKQARRGRWTVRAGMIAYDALSFDKTLPHHRMLSRSETLQHAPELNREGLLGAAVYFDAQVEFAERLMVENALSALAHGATVATYAHFDKLNVEAGEVCSVQFTREARGSSPTVREGSGGESARTRIVINAAGPWVDQVLSEGAGNSPRLIGGTKGSHIIVAPFVGAPETAVYVEAEADRRPFFVIPWNRNYLIGTTDIRYDGDLDNVRIATEEIDYLLRETNRAIPKAQLTREHILYTYSGIRPLPFTADKDEQSITRKHFIRRHPQIVNLFSIVGGKLTTYRSLAEQTVNLVMKQLQLTGDRGRLARNARHSIECATARVPLPGADTPDFGVFCEDFKKRSALPVATNDRLLRIYGTRASLVLDLVDEDRSLAAAFDSETGAIAAEVIFAFKHELAETLSDCLLRRTMVGLNSTCGLEAVEAAACIAQKHVGWSQERAIHEVAAFRDDVSYRFK